MPTLLVDLILAVAVGAVFLIARRPKTPIAVLYRDYAQRLSGKARPLSGKVRGIPGETALAKFYRLFWGWAAYNQKDWSNAPTITKWNQKAGPRVGDWCETKDSGLHRIGAVEAAIRLAAQSGRFSLDTSEGVTYSGLFVDYPAIQKSSLVRQSQSKAGTIHQPRMNLPCRVFKET